MPIKDLQRDKPGLTKAGIIRLGYKAKKCKQCKAVNISTAKICEKCGKADFQKRKQGEDWVEMTYPVPADHFVLTDAPGVAEALGTSTPRDLRIYFPFNDPDLNFPAYHQYWVASALVCRGDGEHVHYAINPQTGETTVRDGRAIREFESSTTVQGQKIKFKPGDNVECPGLNHDLYAKCEFCKPNAMLIVLLRDVPRLAYFQIATTSIHNIVNLSEQMTYIRQTIGRLQGVPFILKLRPQKISVPNVDRDGNLKKDGNGKQLAAKQRVEKWLLSLEVDPEWVQKLMDTQSRLADPARRLLAETVAEEEDIIDYEPSPLVPQMTFEPPVWMPPNGGDDSGFEPDEDYGDFAHFVEQIIKAIPFYRNRADIETGLAAIGMEYSPETVELLTDELAKYASRQADAQASQPKLM